MGEKIVYHGGPWVLVRPVCGGGTAYRDFGRGFYCTTRRELAEEWACAEGRGGFVSQYALDTDALCLLDLTSETIGPFRWLGLLAAHRRFSDAAPDGRGAAWFRANACPDLNGWDAVLGWRGDGSYFSMARAVFRDEVSTDLLYRVLSEDGTQLVLRSPQALAALRFQSYAAADPSIFAVHGRERDRAVRTAFFAAAGQPAQTVSVAGCTYDPLYLPEAMDNLGEALDYAVHGCGL